MMFPQMRWPLAAPTKPLKKAGPKSEENKKSIGSKLRALSILQSVFSQDNQDRAVVPLHSPWPSSGQRPDTGLIGTEGVGSQRIAGVGVGAGARSTAEVAVFARTALPMELAGGVERAKHFGITVHVHQRIGAHVAALERQESGRINVSQGGNEDDSVPRTNLD